MLLQLSMLYILIRVALRLNCKLHSSMQQSPLTMLSVGGKQSKQKEEKVEALAKQLECL